MTKSYHHGNLRAALIDAAVGLAREGGPDAVVLREMARLVGVSHNAAYRHFSDRDEVMAEVAAFGMGQLEAAMRSGIATVRSRDPKVRARHSLREVGRAYVHFALENPGLFTIAFTVMHGEPSEERAAEMVAPYALLNEVLDELLASGAMPAKRRPSADMSCWSAVHGFSLLHLTGPGVEVPSPGEPMVEREAALDDLLMTIERGLIAP
ncbi:MAG: TetR/AcrR family transcriptional regulator [Marmoricola sp.]|nr:TetR/AcrR family transcriptional regulator [Marmoricola sp.]